MKIAAIQMVSGTDLSQNLVTAKSLLKTAASLGAELAVLPENFSIMPQHENQRQQCAETLGDLAAPTQAMLAQTSKALGMWVVAGSLPIKSKKTSDRVVSTSLVYDPQGKQVAQYDKIHLFRFNNGREQYDEHLAYEAGSTPTSFMMTPKGAKKAIKVGMSICYDLRFPELYRALSAKEPCDLMLIPSAFTFTTGREHWEILIRARAIENQSYVIAAAQGGIHPSGRHTWGGSMIVNPWGQVLAMQAQNEGVIMSEMDFDFIKNVRTQLPVLNHRVLG